MVIRNVPKTAHFKEIAVLRGFNVTKKFAALGWSMKEKQF